MSFIKKHKSLIICIAIATALLGLCFLLENHPAPTNDTPSKAKDDALTSVISGDSPATEKPLDTYEENKEVPNTEDDKPDTTEEEQAPPTDKLTCFLSVRCDTLLSSKDMVKEEKQGLIPKDGVIYPETEVVFYENETAFNVIQRELKQNKIHMEFEYTPAYESMYIEGIANIYEFDAGELSGWLCKVNGQFLSKSTSQYTLQKGDKIEILYTCNLGNDLK